MLYCIFPNKEHNFIPTGKCFRVWSSSNTYEKDLPKNVIYYQEEKCCLCGLTRNIKKGN